MRNRLAMFLVLVVGAFLAISPGPSIASAAAPVLPPATGAQYSMPGTAAPVVAPGPITTPAEEESAPVAGPLTRSEVRDWTEPRRTNPNANLHLAQQQATMVPPPAAAAGGPSPFATLQRTFPGLGGENEGGLAPADPSAAAGPYNVVEEVNTQMAAWPLTGGAPLFSMSLNTWYNVPGDTISDTHVIFEPQGKHFMTLAMDETKNAWLLRVSANSDARNSWCTYVLPALNSGDHSTSVDFPLIGSSPNDVLLTIVEKPNNGNRLYEIPKTALEACQSIGGWVWQDITDPGLGTTVHPLVPVLNYDGSDSNNYLIDSYSDGGAYVSLYKIDPSNRFTAKQVGVPAYVDPTPAPQPNSNVVIATGNTSITQAVNYKNGLYASLTSGYNWGGAGNNNSVIDWMKFNPSAQTLLSDGFAGYPGYWYFYSSMSEAFNGSSLFTYSLATSALYVASAALAMDVNNNFVSNGFLQTGSYSTPQSGGNFKCGGVPCSRWGDFSSTYDDPTNVNSFWCTAERMDDPTTWGTILGLEAS